MTREELIEQYKQHGFPLFPLVAGKKVPLWAGWPDRASASIALVDLPGNYGIALRSADLVIDADPRHFPKGVNVLKQLLDAFFGKAPDTFIVRTGGGGFHIYLSKPENTEIAKGMKDFPGIEFLTKKHYVVGPGSVHPDTQKRYAVAYGALNKIVPAPPALLKALTTEKKLPEKGLAVFADDAQSLARFLQYLRTTETAKEGQQGDQRTFAVACVGRDYGLSPERTIEAMSDWNERCEPPWAPEELLMKVRNAYEYAGNAVGVKHPAADFEPVAPAEIASQPWVVTRDGALKPCLRNVLCFFEDERCQLHNLVGYNSFTSRVEFMKLAPWHEGKMPPVFGVSDNDLKYLKAWLATTHAFEMAVTTLEEAIAEVARRNTFHPVRDYLNSLEWDGIERLNRWLPQYTGAERTPYSCAVGRKTLCALVKRVFEPGCKFDYTLVLEGQQGVGKSRLCAALGGSWYTDIVMDPHDKDCVSAMNGKWLAEISEMEVTKRADTMALKAFLSRQVDRVRPAYGKFTVEFPRQCVFIGSINPEGDGSYLRDSTGNRRFWPVSVSKIDVDGLAKVRDQLFAEAKVAVDAGEKLYFEDEKVEIAALKESADRYTEDPWTEAVLRWIDSADTKAEMFLSTRDTFIGALGGTDRTFSRLEQLRISVIMRRAGWAKGQGETKSGARARGFFRP